MRNVLFLVVCSFASPFDCTGFARVVEPEQPPAAAPKAKSAKGWELYARFDADKKEWRFGLLHGTNRLKTEKEIADAITLEGTKGLQTELARLEEGQSVFLNTRVPGTVRQEVQDACAKQKLKFVDAPR